jgi:hypothetical protein
MKIVICLIVMSALTGCASISEYNQGCRDGIENLKIGSLKQFRENYCNALDKQHKAEKKIDNTMDERT